MEYQELASWSMGGEKQNNISEPIKKRYSYKKPWWLVITLFLTLILFGTHIGWHNSPYADQSNSYWDYILGAKITEEVSDDDISLKTLGTDENTSFDKSQPVQDTIQDSWNQTTADQAPQEGYSETEAELVETPSEPAPPPATVESVYYINAGTFKSKASALFRMKELQQGNYTARLLEPSTPQGNYQVIVGEYKSFNEAREQARSIEFVLEIKTSVEKK